MPIKQKAHSGLIMPALAPCKPLLKWSGGKTSELPVISPLIPDHDRYFEPFFGGGSVYFGLVSTEAYGNDLNPDLMEFYRCVKESDEAFSSQLYSIVDEWDGASFEGRNRLYYECRDRYNQAADISPAKAADFWAIRELAYGGMVRFNADGEFNISFGRAYAYNKNLRAKADYLRSEEVAAKMANLVLSATDFAEFADSHQFGDKDFMFVDPPYDSAFSKYGVADFTEQDQERLAECLNSFGGRFMLVCKHTPLIDRLYGQTSDFQVSLYDKQYKFNIKSRFDRTAVHALITNYEQVGYQQQLVFDTAAVV